MKGDGFEAAKRRAGESAAERVEDGMVVGLGTGSTAAYAIERLGERVDAGLDVAGIPTSYQSRHRALDAAIPLTSLDRDLPDIAIDGADEVSGRTLLKGGGAAHAREKVVDTAADRFLVVVDERKETETLRKPIPVEVLPSAHSTVASAISDRGGAAELRAGVRKDGPVVTDNGNFVLDCDYGPVEDPRTIARELERIPGVVEHGLFLDCADEVHVGTEDDVRIERY